MYTYMRGFIYLGTELALLGVLDPPSSKTPSKASKQLKDKVP